MDVIAALHAKVISVDGEKTLITSANLSYHGQQGNIELGTVIDSKDIADQGWFDGKRKACSYRWAAENHCAYGCNLRTGSA
ncbi:MAG: hypothetical protein HFH39_07390 [Lachnospiraceae bacterium]|nr:hypothetical protein [Lachnospiraceae bacterium]